MASKEFLEIVEKMKEIHVKKNQDYSTESDPLSNFKFAAQLVSSFSVPIDQVFIVLIGIKLARLGVLLNSGKTPQNESVIDSFIDLSNYCALWGAARMEMAPTIEQSQREAIEKMAKESKHQNDLLEAKQEAMFANDFYLNISKQLWISKKYNANLKHYDFSTMSIGEIYHWINIIIADKVLNA